MFPVLPAGNPLFPPVEQRRSDGLLAVGGDLTTNTLLTAYRLGIFPWYSSPPILWWYPDPRFVLFTAELHVSKTMRQLLKNDPFRYTLNTAFDQVMHLCGTVKRKGQSGTWISRDMEEAYHALHREGYAVSAEAWLDGRLVGGLYGVRLGSVFFGESMFSLRANASKAAFIHYMYHLREQDVPLVDCQVHSNHLVSLGAREIPAGEFKHLLEELIP